MRNIKRRVQGSAFLGCLVFATTQCGSDPWLTDSVASDHFEYRYRGERPCERTLQDLEAYREAVSAWLGLDILPDKIVYNRYGSRDELDKRSACQEPRACTIVDDGSVSINADSAMDEHELLHGMLAEAKGPQKFLEEGLASTLECAQKYDAVELTAEDLASVTFPMDSKSYDASARLVSQVIKDYGVSGFMKLYYHNGTLAEVFDEVLGVSLDDVWASAQQLTPTDVATCACGDDLVGSEEDAEVSPSACTPFGRRVPFSAESGARALDITGELVGFKLRSCFGAHWAPLTNFSQALGASTSSGTAKLLTVLDKGRYFFSGMVADSAYSVGNHTSTVGLGTVCSVTSPVTLEPEVTQIFRVALRREDAANTLVNVTFPALTTVRSSGSTVQWCGDCTEVAAGNCRTSPNSYQGDATIVVPLGTLQLETEFGFALERP